MDLMVTKGDGVPLPDQKEAIKEFMSRARRRTDSGKLAECPMCGSLDIGGASNTVSCYGCGLSIKKPAPLQNAIDAWNTRGGVKLKQLYELSFS